MRTIVQISDLHFGASLVSTLDPLVEQLRKLAPDLTIISGDLTQRATREQFANAQRYLARLPEPQLVIPGNHDIPLYNVMRRFVSPLDHYDTFISPNHNPTFVDDEIAVVGINSARSFTFKGGTISREQRENAAAIFKGVKGNQVRIVVTHHPFDIPVGLSGVSVVRGASEAIHAFAECTVDLFLTGHLHLVHSAPASVFVPGYNAPMLVAGTATSTRARGEPNSFYVIRTDCERTDNGAISIETHTWNAARNRFEASAAHSVSRAITAREAE